MNKLLNKIDCVNSVEGFANVIVPMLIKELKANPPKFKTDGSLFKKSLDPLNNIIKREQTDDFHSCWIRPPAYSYLRNTVTVYIKGSYKTGEYSCNYYDTQICIWTDGSDDVEWTPSKTIYYDDVMAIEDKMKHIQKHINILEKVLSDLKGEVYPIL